MRPILVFLLCTAVGTNAQPAKITLEDRLLALINSTPGSKTAHWGILAVDLKTGKPLIAHNEKRLFIPASNTKLFTTALAFERLGPAHRFHTKIVADLPPDPEGKISGDLRLVGGGDPTLSGRIYPYQTGPAPNPPFGALEQLADQLIARGIKSIQGDVIGDDSYYPHDPFPAGWAVDDPAYEYGSPVSALIVNDNAFRLTLEAGNQPGDPPQISLFPNVEYFVFQNNVATVEGRDRKINLQRSPSSNEVILSGTIGVNSRSYTELLGVDDPALFAASVLREILERRGVRVDGVARAQHRAIGAPKSFGGQILAERVSPPLAETAKVVNKVSQNLHAEILLREVGLHRRGEGTVKLGQEEMVLFLSQTGSSQEGFYFEDGSGLSRLTLLTPETSVKLLQYMHRSKNAKAFAASLPVGSADGTLDTRFAGLAAAKRIHAKTGSLSHVSALSGYIDSQKHGRLAFSIMVNNFNVPTAEVRKVIDKLALALAE